MVIFTELLAGMAFLLAAKIYPGGDFNPFMRMLSALGRSEVRLVEWPYSAFLFDFGLAVSALCILLLVRPLKLSKCGAILNALGLVAIAAVPENANQTLHDACCWLAAIGGLVILASWMRKAGRRERIVWAGLSLFSLMLMVVSLALHALGLIPFAPWSPSAQKLVILVFAAWFAYRVLSGASLRQRVVFGLLTLSLVGFGVWLFWPHTEPPLVTNAVQEIKSVEVAITDDERRAFDWLERITGPLDAEEEREWWKIGGTQHGVSAKRYHIAFAGYAATALGLRSNGELRERAAGVVRNCIERYLKREVWAYAMSKSYWGKKPWAPDPCYRENVMYTGHLLQLLAFYELLSGDDRYWKTGFDFVWNEHECVHYDVQKLIDVTTYQMRKGPNGGITCEPGLMFFPCNNHPQVAFKIFAALGHGNWDALSRRWEKWAISHYLRPALGGGALNFVYHVRSSLMYPRGNSGLDGWSLLWYEPWATERGRAVALWRECAAAIDWERYAVPADGGRGEPDCMDPAKVPPAVSAVFLAAAARACDDEATALRLEKAVDERYLSHGEAGYCLNVNREWRVGATAMRIIAIAEANGFRFRNAAMNISYATKLGSSFRCVEEL